MSESGFQYEDNHKDALEEFFVNPSKDRLPTLLQSDVEYDYLDFKGDWIKGSKLARHILGFSNKGGGILVIGIHEEDTDDNPYIRNGVEDIWDTSTLGNKVEKYLPEGTDSLYRLRTYPYDDHYNELISGKSFQVIFIDSARQVGPLVAASSGDGIVEGVIYTRRNTSTANANYREVQKFLKNRIESEAGKTSAELHQELNQLKTLYGELEQNISVAELPGTAKAVQRALEPGLLPLVDNPQYPDESYDEFISTLVDKKKAKIEDRLGVSDVELP